MSSVSQAYLCELNPNAQLIDYGQDSTPRRTPSSNYRSEGDTHW